MFTQDQVKRFEARRQAEMSQAASVQAPVEQEKPKGRSGLLRFLPTALGVGATLAAAPFTGGASLAGTAAILGGAAAAGSGLGELGAQVFGGEKIDTGRIGKEALISGATGAIPIGGAAKAAKVARTAGTEVAEQTAKKTLRGRVAEAGQGIRTSVVNPKVSASPFGAATEADIVTSLQREGIKGSAKNQYRQLGTKMKELGSELDAKLAVNKNSVGSNSVRTMVKDTAKDSTYFVGSDRLHQKELAAVLDQYVGKTGNITAAQAAQAKKKLASKMEPVFKKIDAGGDLNAKQAAQHAVWESLDNVITSIAPEAKELTLRQSKLFAASSGLKQSSEKGLGIPLLGVKSTAAERGVQSAKDLTGRVMTQGAGVLPTMGTGLTSRVLREGVKQEVGGFVGNQVLPDAPETPELTQEDAMIADDTMADAGITPDILEQPDQVREGLKAAALQALASGDTKGLESIVKTAGLLESLGMFATDTGTSTEKPLSAEASKTLANANSGLTSLAQLKTIIDKSGVPKGTLLPGRGLGGAAGANILGTAEYDTAARNVKDVITRLRTGAALTDSEERFYNSQIPQAFDSPEVIEQKINLFNDLFTSISNRTGSAGTDLQASIGV